MGFLTRITTHVRTRRAAVMLYAMVLVGLLIYANFVLIPLVERNAREESVEQKGFSGACFSAARHGGWALPVVLIMALIILIHVSRGKMDRRLAALSFWLILANALIVGFYVVALWWYYGSHYSG